MSYIIPPSREERDLQDGYFYDFGSLENVLEKMENCEPSSLGDKKRWERIFKKGLKKYLPEEEVDSKLADWDETCLSPEELKESLGEDYEE